MTQILISFALILFFMLLGLPVALTFGVAIIYLVASLGFDPAFLLPTAYSKLGSVVMLAIPLFILAGGIMEKGKIGGALLDFIELFVGRIKGGLAPVATISCAVFGAICGSGSATLSCIGSIIAPKMKEAKYPMGIVGAVMACAAPLGMLIPPSSAQILIAWSAQLSVLACFLSTVFSGILVTFLISVTSLIMLRNNPDIETQPKISFSDWPKTFGRKTKTAFPALMMPIIILGGIYGGFMTPSEAAAVAVIYAIPVSVYIYKGFKMKELGKTVKETAISTGVIMIMLCIIMMYSRILIMENVPTKLMGVFLKISDNPKIIMLMINIFMILIGMIMDDVSGTLLCTPLLMPIAVKLGMSPYQFAAIIGVNLGMGNITPPCAPFLYLSARVCKTSAQEIMKPALIIMCCAYLPTLIIVTLFPGFSLWLPNLIMGGRF